jgi:hypothetical protein
MSLGKPDFISITFLCSINSICNNNKVQLEIKCWDRLSICQSLSIERKRTPQCLLKILKNILSRLEAGANKKLHDPDRKRITIATVMKNQS